MIRLEIRDETNKEAAREMAELLHESCCTQDHADTCGWYYDGGGEEAWQQKAHVMWYQKARRFIPTLKERYEKKENGKK